MDDEWNGKNGKNELDGWMERKKQQQQQEGQKHHHDGDDDDSRHKDVC